MTASRLRAPIPALILATLGALAGTSPAVAAPARFKVATLAPQGSIWDGALRSMGARWARDTSERVSLTVFPGGVAGDESDIVRKMRIGQFQGAGLTSTGLAEIDPAFKLFEIPMQFSSWAELEAVISALEPEFDRRLADKGFVRVAWSHGGWVHLFSREPIRTLDDLKRQKLFVWAGADEQVQQWRKSGFQPVPLPATEVTLGFQTGLIDVVPTTPAAALSLQWYRQAPYMTALGLAPLVGAVVVRKDAWEKVSATDRELLIAAGRELEERLLGEVPKQDDESLAQMKARGLTVIELAADQRAAWTRAAESFAEEARVGTVPPDILSAARAKLAELAKAEESAP
ncbi:MAG: TRAP transporter substrate-binding protein DctP [Acidobacteria bacterium]|nr:TRAP transporter substrate-binding protein DctP [Acidobacteriota bacterium]MCB9378440.1 TRAP transporter substrate-binding protein DctP [Holophagales bacterium]